MLYMEIIAVWSENRKKHTNANFSVHFGNESPTFRYHHVTNAGNWLPKGAEPLSRTKTSATSLRRAESSREKTLRGQRVYWCNVWLSHLVVELSLGFEGLLSALAGQIAARVPPCAQPCRESAWRALRFCTALLLKTQVLRYVTSCRSASSFQRFTVKSSEKNGCTEPTTQRHIPRDLSFGELT